MVPCYNEENTLPLVFKSIPKQIEGVDAVETLIIDDGSSDKTAEVAKELGATKVVSHVGNKGLAKAFATGINTALDMGADIIVNTDGDNQYPQQSIPQLIKPIISGVADIVVGDRQTSKISHFSFIKKRLQSFGSWVVRLASDTKIPDAVSGFRAYSREAALRLNVVTSFSYCVETIVQAGKRRITITHIPVETNPKTRESRLFKNMGQHIVESAKTIIRVYSMYQPFKVFATLGVIILFVGVIGLGRFFYFYFFVPSQASGHIQSVVISSILFLVGFQVMLIGLLSDLISINRKLIEDALYRIKKIELKGKS